MDLAKDKINDVEDRSIKTAPTQAKKKRMVNNVDKGTWDIPKGLMCE